MAYAVYDRICANCAKNLEIVLSSSEKSVQAVAECASDTLAGGRSRAGSANFLSCKARLPK